MFTSPWMRAKSKVAEASRSMSWRTAPSRTPSVRSSFRREMYLSIVLRGLFVQLSIAEADDLGDDLKGDPFAHADLGKVIPDDFLDGVEGHRFSARGFRRDVPEKDSSIWLSRKERMLFLLLKWR